MSLRIDRLPIFETTRPGDLHPTFQYNKRQPVCSIATGILSKIILCGKKIPPGLDSRNPIHFVTSRREKFEEVSTQLEGLHIVQKDISIPTLEKVQNLSLIAAYRAFKAFYKLHGKPILIEETSLKLEKYEGPFPGRQYKEVVELGTGKRQFAKEHAGEKAIFETVFAYTADGKTAHIFKSEASGTIVNPEKWIEGDGADPHFQLNGYNMPISHMSTFKHFVYPRQFPCAELRTMLLGKIFKGVFELHVTVANCMLDEYQKAGNILKPEKRHIEQFTLACNKIGVKPLVIGMDKETKPVQLQTAIYVTCKDGFPEALKRINDIAQDLLKMGFPSIRNRVEAMLQNPESPVTEEDALKQSGGNYFEFHARMVEVPKDRRDDFMGIIERYRRDNVGTHHKGKFKVAFSTVGENDRYFVNAKGYAIGSRTALILWEELLGDLEKANLKIAKRIIPEYVVYDQKPNLDYEETKEEKKEEKKA